MKYLTLLTAAALALSFGACANKDTSSSSMTTATQSTTGYSK